MPINRVKLFFFMLDVDERILPWMKENRIKDFLCKKFRDFIEKAYLNCLTSGAAKESFEDEVASELGTYLDATSRLEGVSIKI